MRHEKHRKIVPVQNVAVAGSHHYYSLSLKMLFVCLYPREMVLHGKYRLCNQLTLLPFKGLT